jgi:hypothetical protein
VLNVQVAAGAKSLASGNDFFKVYGQYQHWNRSAPDNQLLFRTEIGTTIASAARAFPEDFLFRAGGLALQPRLRLPEPGPREGQRVVGGRYMPPERWSSSTG